MSKLPAISGISLPENISGVTAEEVRKNLSDFFRDQEGFASNTIRDLFSVTKLFANWCVPRGYVWFPADPEHCREYLIWMKEERNYSIHSVKKHLAMLNMLMGIAGLPKLSGQKTVDLGVRKLRRTAATGGERAGQAIPFRFDDLKVAERLYKQAGSTIAIRNRAFLCVAYNTMLRMSEIARLRVRDVEVHGDNVTLFVAYTKTNTVTETIKQLSPMTAKALFDWLTASGLKYEPDAMLFCKVHRTGKVTPADQPMSAPALEKIFADTWLLMGKDDEQTNKGRYAKWSGHSCRVGAAQDLNASGASMPQIMAEGGWKDTETVMRYLRNSGNVKSAVSDLMKR